MRYAIRVNNAPRNSPGAVLPMPAQISSASTGGLRRQAFYPGTMVVPARGPALPPPSADPKTMPSNVVPNAIRPAIGIPYPDNMGPPVAVFSDNVAPAAAAVFVRIPRQTQVVKPRLGGRIATSAARVITRWRTYGGGTA